MFVAESGGHTQMTRLGGRARAGQRLVAHVPHGHYPASTFIAAGRWSGACAPCLFDEAMDGEMFLAWVREAIEAAGARRRYLPPYSPDFNPIENRWRKIKQRLRGLAPRTGEELLAAAKTAFESVSIADCQGFFLPARYAI